MQVSHNGSSHCAGAAGIIDDKVARLIAIGASMAANNETGLIEAIESLRADGAHEDEIRMAVQFGQTVKDKPAGIMKKLADEITGTTLVSGTAWECPAEKMKQDTSYAIMMLIAAGSAMAANCEPCLNKAVPNLIEAGVGEEDIRRTLEIGQSVKDRKADEMKEAADILAGTKLTECSAVGCLAGAECPQRSDCDCV